MAALLELQNVLKQRASEREISLLDLDGRYELYQEKGVLLEHLFVRPVDPQKPYDSGLVYLLAGVMVELDAAVNEHLDLFTSPEAAVFKVYKDTDELGRIQDRFISGLVSLDQHIDNKKRLQILIPKMGAIPLMEAALQKGLDSDRVHPVDIYGGTVVDVTGGAKLTGNIPDVLLDKENIVAFIDDVGDSWNTAILFARKRRAHRLGKTWEEMEEKDEYQSLTKNIQLLWEKKQFNAGQIQRYGGSELLVLEEKRLDDQLREQYKRAAWLFQAEGVVVGFLFSKNSLADEALNGMMSFIEQSGDGASPKEKEWLALQKHMAGVTAPADKERWITGGQGILPYRMFDISIEGKQILKHIRNRDVRALLKAGNVDNLLFRTFAGLEKLVQFNSAKTKDVTKLVAAWVEASLARYHDVQEGDGAVLEGKKNSY